MNDSQLDKTRLAFNLGCDARIAGLSKVCNPYDPYAETFLKSMWNKGWDHVDKEWGCDVKGKWPINKLPKVPEYTLIWNRGKDGKFSSPNGET